MEESVYNVRLNIGKALSHEFPADADVVMPVPDSAITAAIGYSRESGLRLMVKDLLKTVMWEEHLSCPHKKNVKRSVRLKMNPIKSELEGKKIVLVDDSIVRGTTSKSTVEVLKGSWC